MANNYNYDMRVVAKNKELLERFVSILRYKDPEYYLYRVYSVDPCEIKKEGALFYIDISGMVEWGCSRWLFDSEGVDRILREEDNKKANYVSLPVLCKRLNIGVELWSDELGSDTRNHCLVNRRGIIVIDAREDGGHSSPKDIYYIDLEVYVEGESERKDFLDDEDKMRDFFLLSRDAFLTSYSYLSNDDYDATIAAIESKLEERRKK